MITKVITTICQQEKKELKINNSLKNEYETVEIYTRL